MWLLLSSCLFVRVPDPTHRLQKWIFLNFNIFWKLILNITRSVFLKTTLLAAPITLARSNACAAPCIVARHRADVAVTGSADR